MNLNNLKVFKPDIEESAKRWDAFWQKDIIDRPILISSCFKPGFIPAPTPTYETKAFGDIDKILDDALHNAEGLYFGGDSIPTFWPTFAADEIAAYCGARIEWSKDSKLDTNWSIPFVKDWEDSLPLAIDENNYFWKRMIEFYSKCAEKFNGRILPRTLDFHTNMDLLSAARGPEQLCIDLYECPELIDIAMENAREIFKKSWNACVQAGRMDQLGYYFEGFPTNGSVGLISCDFICMIGSEMFRRWALPTMEYEASLMDHVLLHWDGPGALKHFDDIMGIEKLHLISYVPNPDENHPDYLDMYKRIQSAGKAVTIVGPTDLIKAAHRELDPSKTVYYHLSWDVNDTEELSKWLTQNT